MCKLFKDAKGAVTVFITLLLIPAVLVSGTAVDLARLHTARSILQDANQLAANSVLTQYNALLYDMYGLFGVANDDPILGKLLDDYISVSVFGERLQDRSLGTFQLFYGSDLSLEELYLYDDMKLSDEDVLRRQIEEYMKFRGPVIIVKEIIEALDNNTLKADTEVVEDKTAIDSDIVDLYDKYKELYNAIVAADKCTQPIGGISGSHFGTVSSHLKLIRSEFIDLKACYKAWENLKYEGAEASAEIIELQNDYAAKYTAILGNISAYTVGGRRGDVWSNGRWISYRSGNTGLNSLIESAKQNGDNFKTKFEEVVNIARQVDAMHDELSHKIDELERKLNSGNCSEELRKGLTEKHGDPPMSLIERYRDILKWDNVAAMATTYRNGGYDYIDNAFKPMLDAVGYRNSRNLSAGSLTRAQLADLASNPEFALSEYISAANSKAALFAGFPEDSVTYSMPPGFKKFAEHPGENRAFFQSLTAMVNQPALDPVKLFDGQEDGKGADAEEKQRNIVDTLLELIDAAYAGLTNDPLGADWIRDSETPEPERLGILDILALIPQALGDSVVGVIEDPMSTLGNAADYVLLLTYSTSMFSNYTTARPESNGKTRNDIDGINFPESIAGIPLSPRVNYFFQSEWEYLYHGSQDAGENLSAVTKLIFLIRLVCNYITVFSVTEIATVITAIEAAFGWCPVLGLILGELARAAFAAAETMIDVAMLRSGHKVRLFKRVSQGEWICSPSGVVNAIGNISKEALSDSSEGSGTDDEKGGLSYSNYLMFFLLAKTIAYTGEEKDAATELAKRTGDLIEWNMINYKNDVNADEEKMIAALSDENRFRLSDMMTGFGISTTVNLKMLFLSMPFARRGIGNTIPPATMPIAAADYRGY